MSTRMLLHYFLGTAVKFTINDDLQEYKIEESNSSSTSDVYSMKFEPYEDDEENKNGGGPVESDSDDTREITIHLIKYNSSVHKGGSNIANSMGIISGLFVIAICAIFPR